MQRNGLMAMTAFALTVLAAPASGKAEPLVVSGDIGVASQYVWRGSLQKGQPVVQGDLSVSAGELSASAWFSNSYASPEPQFAGKDVLEFDFTVDYSGNIGNVGYSLGSIYYTYLYDAHSNFVEVYAGLSYDAVVSPSLTVYYTAKGVQSGFYKTGDIWVDLALSTAAAGFDMAATISYVSWKSDAVNRAVVAGLDRYKNGISLVQLAISKDIEVGDLTFTPSMAIAVPVVGKSANGSRYIYGGVVHNEFIAALNIAY